MNETEEEMLKRSATRVRMVINGFLDEKLKAKLKTVNSEEEKNFLREERIRKHAKDAGKVQQASHANKYMHPDARGTCLISGGNPNAGERYVGTHTVKASCDLDAVFYGGAAYIPIYDFVSLELDGKTLLERADEGDAALTAALSDDPVRAESYRKAFAAIATNQNPQRTHTLAKQVYWPLYDGGYHLLGPLFPTSLFHEVWKTVREDRFSNEAKAARNARREDAPHERGYREYPNLLVQKHGGAQPQNISCLNFRVRHGECYLLPSCPPTWVSDPVKPPLHVRSIFDGPFGRRKRVRVLIRVLRDFLASVRDYNNIRIRNKRAELVGTIREELLQFAAAIQELAPGWSANEDCRLNMEEQCWLDPFRAREDEPFASVCGKGNWKDAVCRRFANWLNARLTARKLPMGETEARAWRVFLDEELRMLRMEVSTDD